MPRNSSIELFRILATFLVLIVHWNGWFVGGLPEKFDFNNITLFRCSQLVIRSISVCCVNCFILISGYFGIRLRAKSLLNLYLTLLGIYLPCYLYGCLTSGDISIIGFAQQFLCFTHAGYFIQSYILLMLISPILNAFISEQSRHLHKWILLFIFIEWWYCCMHEDVIGVNQGYSAIHFALMYFVGRTVSINKKRMMTISKYVYITGYFACVIAVIWLYIIGQKWSGYYSCPFVIAMTVCLFMPFLYVQFTNKWINSIAKSTIAVYILQVTYPCIGWLMAKDKMLLQSQPYPLYLAYSFLILTAFFMLSILYDKSRITLTSLLVNQLNKIIK